MKLLCRWLSRDTLPAYVSSFHKAALWCRRDAAGRLVLPLLNACKFSLGPLGIPAHVPLLPLTRDHAAATVTAFRPDDGGWAVVAKRGGDYWLRPPGWACSKPASASHRAASQPVVDAGIERR